MKNILLFFFLCFNFFSGQTNIEGFLLNHDEGTITIETMLETQNLKNSPKLSQNTEIKKGKFSFSLNELTDIPLRVVLIIKVNGNEKFSDRFYIDKYTEKIVLTDEANERFIKVNVSPLNQNQIDFLKFRNYLSSLESETKDFEISLKKKYSNERKITSEERIQVDSITKNFINRGNELKLNFVKNNLSSYISLWEFSKLIDTRKLENPSLLFDKFDENLKKSDLGTLCFEKIDKLQKNAFFDLRLKDLKMKSFNFQDLKLKKYTLIDFWFSYCAPCLIQMPKYKDIYHKYKNQNFEIIGISIDKTKDVDNWKKVIKERNLSWPQYLDENGFWSYKNNIYSFPTNFLIDSEGKIIEKDITQEELEKFLEKNINNTR